MNHSLDDQLHTILEIIRHDYLAHEAVPIAIGLFFLKYLNDLATHIDSEQNSFPLQFSLPKSACWQMLSNDPSGQALSTAVTSIELTSGNEQLQNILPALKLEILTKTPTIYQQVIAYISMIDLAYVQGDMLAASFDRFLEKAITSQGHYASDFYTPSSVSQLLASLLAAKQGSTIYDPACGTASLLLSAYKQISTDSTLPEITQLFGQEINPQTAALAKINLFLHGLSTRVIEVGNTLLNPHFQDAGTLQTFDYVLSNFPMSMRTDRHREYLLQDPFNRFPWGISATLDFAFIQHILASLNQNGRAVFLVSPAVLLSLSKDGELRKNLIEADLVEAVISLPPTILLGTSIPRSILILNKSKPEILQQHILFVRNDSADIQRRSLSALSEEQQARIIRVVHQHCEEPQFSVLVGIAQIRLQNYILSPTKYVTLFDQNRFLGGSVQWIKLSVLAKVIEGLPFRNEKDQEGTTPIIRVYDLSSSTIRVDDLTHVDINQNSPEYYIHHVATEDKDILIGGIRYPFRTYLIEPELSGIFISRGVYAIRLYQDYQHLARYIIEFFNSDIGQSMISSTTNGFGISRIRRSELQQLDIPIPDKSIIDLLNNLHNVESQFIDRVDKTRNLRHRLFNIQDEEKVSMELRNLNTEAHILATSLVQSDSLEFQIRNFYPFPIAFAYRALSTIREPAILYIEQLRVAENILAFLGSIGLILASYSNLLNNNQQTLTRDHLKGYWQGGISPGNWRELGRRSATILRTNTEFAILQGFTALWFKGRGSKESAFASTLDKVIGYKNDFKHDRGPASPHEYIEANNLMKECLDQIMGPLAFFIQNPIRLVLHVRAQRKTKYAILDTLQYMGDHPSMRQEKVTLSEFLPQDDLYIEMASQEWAPLYPLISTHYCPDCKTRETYMIDKWNPLEKKIILKSFERGHTLESGDNIQEILDDLDDWLNGIFSTITLAE